jgi:hypothetical protein
MLKGDDPKYVPSRQNSFDRDHVEQGGRGRSQDSRSTQFRSGPGSARDSASVPSSRANSTYTPSAPTSHSNSRANSRRSSPKRTPLSSPIPLELAKDRLKAMAAAQAAADKSRTNSLEDARPGRPAMKRADTATKMSNDAHV